VNAGCHARETAADHGYIELFHEGILHQRGP
jgi:hypothetical protein